LRCRARDVAAIRAIVGDLVDTDSLATATSPSAVTNPQIPAAPGVVLDIVNATTQEGLAGRLETAFAARGFTAGTAGTADSLATASTIEYGTGAAAQALANELGMTATRLRRGAHRHRATAHRNRFPR
jgi:hypothetical protein